jgi:hypothetical protein
VITGCRWFKKMITAKTTTSRTKRIEIKPGTSHRRLSFELLACFVSMVFGMVKNDSERGDCTSILFNAFRMELNLIILYPIYSLNP